MAIEGVLRSLGLSEGLSWDSDGNIFGRENLTPEQNVALDVALAAYNPMDEIIAARILEAAAACDAALAPLASRFSEYETKTWEKQLAEAKAILAGDTNPTIEKYPNIGGIIAVTGESWGDFAMAVDANNQRWTAIVANVAGQRQRFVAAMKKAAAKDGATGADGRAVPLSISLPTSGE